MSARTSTRRWHGNMEAEVIVVLYDTVPSPVGDLLLAGTTDGLTHVLFLQGRRPLEIPAAWTSAPERFTDAAAQLATYFAGTLRTFSLRLAPGGTEFQRRVWDELKRIPYGDTISYRELARRIGNDRAVRAVGLANGANPLSIVVPCHRVIGQNGTLVGYGGGLPAKQFLLEHERRCRWNGVAR